MVFVDWFNVVTASFHGGHSMPVIPIPQYNLYINYIPHSFPGISPANHTRTIPISSLYHLYTNSMEPKGYLRCTFGVPRGILRPILGAGSSYPRGSPNAASLKRWF